MTDDRTSLSAGEYFPSERLADLDAIGRKGTTGDRRESLDLAIRRFSTYSSDMQTFDH